MSRSDVIATRLSGGLASSTIPVVPLKTAPEPAPISAPAIRNSARFGVERRTETTSSTRPASMEIVPSASTRDARSVASWDTTPQAKSRKSAAPDSACEGWCSVVARKSPDSPANRPFAEKAARVPAAAGTGSLTLRREPAGFFSVAGARAPARPSPARPTSRSARSPRARRTQGRARSAAVPPTARGSRRSAGRRQARRRSPTCRWSWPGRATPSDPRAGATR